LQAKAESAHRISRLIGHGPTGWKWDRRIAGLVFPVRFVSLGKSPKKIAGDAAMPPIFNVLTAAALFALPAAAQAAPFTVVETGRGYNQLKAAVEAIGNGNGTIIIASGAYGDCAVQTQGAITYRAQVPGRAILDGGICEGKASLVLRGRAASVEGIIFQNQAVPDGNGAGIRLEKGNLTVLNSLFRNAEQGILTADDPNGRIVIDRSTFSRLGRCDRGLSCAHSIYIGNYGALSVANSRFEKGNGGHYVKSRTPRTSVTDSSFDDTQGRTTNYMIDLPAGSVGEIARNIFVQGENKENWSAFIAVAAEGRNNSSAGLAITGNRAELAAGVSRNTWFVANWSNDSLRLSGNSLGRGLTAYQKR
jgi:hypothetical protein